MRLKTHLTDGLAAPKAKKEGRQVSLPPFGVLRLDRLRSEVLAGLVRGVGRDRPGRVLGLGGARELRAQVRAQALRVDAELLSEGLRRDGCVCHVVTSLRRVVVHALNISQRGAHMCLGIVNVIPPHSIIAFRNRCIPHHSHPQSLTRRIIELCNDLPPPRGTRWGITTCNG